MEWLYHVCGAADWRRAEASGQYEHPSLAIEGFIHCSTASQVEGVLSRYFKGQTGLVRLSIDPGKITSPLKWEISPSLGEAFPHVYGPINVDAVISIEEVKESY